MDLAQGIQKNHDMGEEKRRKTRTQKLIEANPFCCFCGGTRSATSADHIPPIQMFDLRQRPSGLECPACDNCNNRMGAIELIPCLIGRVHPDVASQAKKDEVQKLFDGVKANFPGLLESMWIDSDAQKATLTNLDQSLDNGDLRIGDAVNLAVRAFIAKLSLGLHWSITGRIVPSSGVVAVSWYSNFDRLSGRLSQDLFSHLGQPMTLQQGSKGVFDQFTYQYGLVPTGDAGLYVSTFRSSFLGAGFVYEDASEMLKSAKEHALRPGLWPTVTDIVDLIP